ncbi:hypothetical protein [Micropruina sonneratiae]|uniref:hypothetical protein n=1 Tax=Micropruina sonneratiae TaxID=2986940 RepID=UPI002226BD80|nr:hypothetical protein [Micropruina sp. KQZ13P-5]MCW3159236.1 hypothetical protein [Micropruina sp. KQZ13P-5]
MQPTTKRLGRIAGSALAGAGALFLAVQINHPELTLEFVGSREFLLRESAKMLMAGLGGVGVVTLTMWHGRLIGAVGVVGAAVFAVGYLVMLVVQAIAAFVLPAIVTTSPDYVRDVLVAALGVRPASDIGGVQVLLSLSGAGYLAGGLLFGIALFRARVVARWASALLAVATTSTVALAVLPASFDRLFAVPAGVALIGIGWSAWCRAGGRGVEPRAGVSEAVR